MNALLLCAGEGTRLRPFTETVPKPLVPVVDQLLLERVIGGVLAAEPTFVSANGHHLFDRLERFVATDGRIDRLFFEPEILGTAGPLARVREEGFREELLVVNGDVWHRLDLKRFVEEARKSGAPMALLGRDNPAVNTLRVNGGRLSGIARRFGDEAKNGGESGEVSRIGGDGTDRANSGGENRANSGGEHRANSGDRPLTFTGVAWYSPEGLARIPAGLFDIREFWKSEWEAGRSPAVIDAGPGEWIDCGTPAGLLDAVEGRLRELGVTRWPEAGFAGEEWSGSAVAEGGICRGRCRLERSYVLPGGVVDEGEDLSGVVVGDTFRWEVSR